MNTYKHVTRYLKLQTYLSSKITCLSFLKQTKHFICSLMRSSQWNIHALIGEIPGNLSHDVLKPQTTSVLWVSCVFGAARWRKGLRVTVFHIFRTFVWFYRRNVLLWGNRWVSLSCSVWLKVSVLYFLFSVEHNYVSHLRRTFHSDLLSMFPWTPALCDVSPLLFSRCGCV